MTDTTDPRIEAVAKILFTGPGWGGDANYWDDAKIDGHWPALNCIAAAEDLLRRIDLRDDTFIEAEIAAWFTSHSSAAITRVIAAGQGVIEERMADGVFE